MIDFNKFSSHHKACSGNKAFNGLINIYNFKKTLDEQKVHDSYNNSNSWTNIDKGHLLSNAVLAFN